MRRGDPGNGTQLAAHILHRALGEPGGDPGPEGQLLSGLNERTPLTGRLLAGHTALAHPELQVISAGGQVFDPMLWSGLDPGGQHAAGGAGRFGGDRFNEDLSSGSLMGGGDDAIVGEVEQNRRSVDWPGILEHGSWFLANPTVSSWR